MVIDHGGGEHTRELVDQFKNLTAGLLVFIFNGDNNFAVFICGMDFQSFNTGNAIQDRGKMFRFCMNEYARDMHFM